MFATARGLQASLKNGPRSRPRFSSSSSADIRLLTSCERVHERLLRLRGDGCGHGGRRGGRGRADGGAEGLVLLLLGLADLGVALGELEPDRLGQVRVEPDALLQWRRELGVEGEGRGEEEGKRVGGCDFRL